MEINWSKSIKLKMRGLTLRNGVDCQGVLKQKGIKQMGIKQGLGVFRRCLVHFLARLLTILRTFVHFFRLMQG
jgi:hypothetical protein